MEVSLFLSVSQFEHAAYKDESLKYYFYIKYVYIFIISIINFL